MTSARRGEGGFSVPEALLSMVLAIAVGFAGLGAIQYFLHALDARGSAQSGAIALEQQLSAMRSDAATAYAVFVPERDIFGHPNAPAPPAKPPAAMPAHEVDFYSRTGAGNELWWAYLYDAAHHSLQRYDYDPNTHETGVANRDTGVLSARARYAAVIGVSSFSAVPLAATDLTTANSSYGSVIAQLLAGSPMAVRADPVGFVPLSGSSRNDLYGGNASVEVRVAGEHGSRTLHLVTSALPSGFTVHAAPSIRAFVYRINILHRFWFGLAQITHAQIFEQLQYSYNASSSSPVWKVWCDYELYGHGIAGLRLNDPDAGYRPRDFNESTAGIYYTATHDGFQYLWPSYCNDRVPAPNATYAPLPLPHNPDAIDTPPPCFAAGRCWPDSAPPEWSPPSPWASVTPPAQWCRDHRQSPLCGAPGFAPPRPSASMPAPGR